MGFLPFYHIYALTWILHTSIAKVGSLMPSLRADPSRNMLGILKQGICVIVMQRFDLQQYLEAVQTYEVTHVHCAPPVAIQMAKNAIVSKYNLKSIRMLVCGAAPLGGDVAQELFEKTQIPIKQAYVSFCVLVPQLYMVITPVMYYRV